MRLFTAVPLSEEARHGIVQRLNDALDHQLPGRAVRPENWHLTLRFLGEVDEVQRDRVAAALDEADLGAPFQVRWGGLGAFPRAVRATVLWIGLDRGTEEAALLAEAVESAVQAAGFPAEERPFRSHLTLSRIRPHQDVTPILQAVDAVGIDMPVDRVVLYESHLGRGGARYEELESFGL
jgi:2'-5' RNA ligase